MPTSTHASRLLFAAFVSSGLACTAQAQTVIKADNTTALSSAASYVGNALPTTSHTLLIDNTLQGTSLSAGIGTGVSVLGVNFTAAPVSTNARAFTLTPSTGSLSIGSGGITKAADTSTFLIQASVVLTANQTWTINAVTGTGTGNLGFQGNISDGGFTATVGGTGRIDFTANTVTVGNGIVFNNAQVVVNGGSAVVTFGNANTTDNFLIAQGRAIGTSLRNFTESSSFGDGGTNTAITLGGNGTSGTLEYSGATASSDRTIQFDRRGASSEIRNSNANSTLTLSGAISNGTGTFTGATSIAFGGDGNITLSGTEQIKDNTQAADATTLNKNGNGTLTITGSNSNTNTGNGTYQGATNVNAGTLLVSGTGSINSTSGVAIASGATFRYDSSTALTRNVTINGGRFAHNGSSNYTGTLTFTSGTLAGTNFAGQNLSIGTGQTLAPGNSTGTMTAGATTWANGGAFQFEINDATGTAGSTSNGWDLFTPTTLALTATSGQFTIAINSLTSGQVGGVAQNFDASTSYSWLFVDAGSAISSFSASIFAINTTGFLNTTNGTFSIAQGSGGDNDKLYLTYSAVPEPSTYTALAGLGALGLVATRRRRRS